MFFRCQRRCKRLPPTFLPIVNLWPSTASQILGWWLHRLIISYRIYSFDMCHIIEYLYRTLTYLGSGCHSLAIRPCWNLTDVTLADEETNSIITHDTNRAIPGNIAVQVAPPNGQRCTLTFFFCDRAWASHWPLKPLNQYQPQTTTNDHYQPLSANINC